ncbi:MAG: hypothetical protein U9O54_05775, partial [Chloroflexota bacterium]|nr:hypothetical protein [Chloroflexota bacterium]
MTKKHWQYILWSIPVMVVLAVLLYQVPFVNDRLAWRIDNWKAQIKYALAPPEEEIFIPGNQQSQVMGGTLQSLTCTPTPTVALTPTIT